MAVVLVHDVLVRIDLLHLGILIRPASTQKSAPSHDGAASNTSPAQTCMWRAEASAYDAEHAGAGNQSGRYRR